MAAPIVVGPPDKHGGRTVLYEGTTLGCAYNVTDLLQLLSQTGLGWDEMDLEGPMFQWRGGGPRTWGSDPNNGA